MPVLQPLRPLYVLIRVTSVFSGSGQRLATMLNNELQSISVYDAKGTLIAEYGNSQPNEGTQYVLTDHQGTPRVRTNPSGVPNSRHDYLPFGEELGSGIGMRVVSQGYGNNDGINKKYAAMEGDASGLAHTLWRKYDSMSARWTTTDPYNASMDVNDPQSFNRYAYVTNDPVNESDPSGLAPADIGFVQTENPWLANKLERAALETAIGSAQHPAQTTKDDGKHREEHQEDNSHETQPEVTVISDPGSSGPGLIEKGAAAAAGIILIGDGIGKAGTAIAGAAAGAAGKGASGGVQGATPETGPQAPETKSPTKPCISEDGPRGIETEKKVLAVLGLPKNTRCINGVIPDAIGKTSVVEVKDAKKVSLSRQIRNEIAVADQQGKRFVLVITERTQRLTGPLIRAIGSQGGQILRYHGDGSIVDETNLWLGVGASSAGSGSGGGLRFRGEIITKP